MARSKDLVEWFGKHDDHDPPPGIKRRIKASASECCEVCGIFVRYGGQVDHTIALCNGGENRETNLRWLCKTCHGAKTAKDIKQKAADHKTQISLAGLKSKGRGWPKPKAKPKRGSWIAYKDENGRDRVCWSAPDRD